MLGQERGSLSKTFSGSQKIISKGKRQAPGEWLNPEKNQSSHREHGPKDEVS